MKVLLKIFLCAIIILIPQLANAEKTDWQNNNFNFKSVKRIVLLNVTSNVDLSGYGSAIQYKVHQDFIDKAKKSRCMVITEDQAKQMLSVTGRDAIKNNISSVADAWVECKIKNWQDSYYIVPAHTEWEQKKMTRRHHRSDGSSWEETYYVTVPVTYPPRKVDVSDLAATFEIFSANTGEPIFVRDDIRKREDFQAQKDMFGRMCNSFFEDFGKKVK